MSLLAGAAKVALEVPPGTPLDGYAGPARFAAGELDPLHARGIVLSDGERRLAVAGLDLLALDADLVAQLRHQIWKSTAIPEAAVLVSCTHTHSGPCGLRRPELTDSRYASVRSMVVAAATRCIAESAGSLCPAAINIGRAQVTGLGTNRRAPAGTIDDELVVASVVERGGKCIAVLANYGCHPTVLGPSNRLVSGDFFGMAALELEASGLAPVVLLTNGGLGDVSTRHTRRSSDPDEARRFGRWFAQHISSTAALAQPSEGPLGIRRQMVRLPLGDLEAQQVEADIVALARRAGETDALSRTEALAELGRALAATFRHAYGPGPISMEVQGVQVAGLRLIGLPGEPFAELAVRIKQRSSRSIAVVAVANGYVGYLPTAAAFPAGGYEVAMCLFGPEVEDHILAAADALETAAFTDGSERGWV